MERYSEMAISSGPGIPKRKIFPDRLSRQLNWGFSAKMESGALHKLSIQ